MCRVPHIIVTSALSSVLSPQVYSAYRFLLAANERQIPVAILNIGPTRADHIAEMRVSARCGQVLPTIQPC